ncbi:hypothetical protein E2C01_050482 [Portunus trituberculatus]|uniref:Uncharacterized protein n=1 Tax=Portunus trituberculatus TaxID=210409 RepID=A0A5B7G8E1_PORTR|nr:hypothetical protein [Portunus trituberculatus]
MARVESMIPGRDGHPRAAIVQMRGIKTCRSLDKLYRLEATPPDSDFNDCTQLESLNSQHPDKAVSNGDAPHPGAQECSTPSMHMTTRVEDWRTTVGSTAHAHTPLYDLAAENWASEAAIVWAVVVTTTTSHLRRTTTTLTAAPPSLHQLALPTLIYAL